MPLEITSNCFRLHASFRLELKANLEISAPLCVAERSRNSEFEQTFSPLKKTATQKSRKKEPLKLKVEDLKRVAIVPVLACLFVCCAQAWASPQEHTSAVRASANSVRDSGQLQSAEPAATQKVEASNSPSI